MSHSNPEGRRWRNLLRGFLAAGALVCVLGQAADNTQERIQAEGDEPRFNSRAGTFSWRNLKLRQGTGTVINAKEATARDIASSYDNSTWVLKGAVHVEFEGAVLDADAAVVVFANKRLKSIEINGAPARFSHQSGTEPRRQGTARNIQYDAAGGKVDFEGDSWFSDGQNAEMRTNHVTYDTRDRSFSSPDKNAQVSFKSPAKVPAPRTPDRATAQ